MVEKCVFGANYTGTAAYRKKLLELATSFFFYLIGNFLRNKIGLMYFFCKIRSNRDNCKKLIFNAKSATLLESGNPKIWLERIFFIFTSKRTNPKNLLLVSQKNPNSPNYIDYHLSSDSQVN